MELLIVANFQYNSYIRLHTCLINNLGKGEELYGK